MNQVPTYRKEIFCGGLRGKGFTFKEINYLRFDVLKLLRGKEERQNKHFSSFVEVFSVFN